MNIALCRITPVAAAIMASSLLLGCATGPQRVQGASAARSNLTQLQSSPRLAGRAPGAVSEADRAVRVAEMSTSDAALGQHRVFIADHKVAIAWAQAETQWLDEQREGLGEQRERARLDSRTREADRAQDVARVARADAETADRRADAARDQADAARRHNEALQRQIDALDARPTEHGLVMVLGDLQFASGRAELREGATGKLARLVDFLSRYPDRTVRIEGHADSTGNRDANLGLSQRRAESVKAFLVARGIAAGRLSASGKGDSTPLAGNDSAAGRQQNRRVELLISDPLTDDAVSSR